RRWQAFIPNHQAGGIELRAWAATAYGALAEEPPRKPPPPPAPAEPPDPRRPWQITAGVAGGATVAFAIGFAVYFAKLRATGPAFQATSSGMIVLDDSGRPLKASGWGYGGYCQNDPSGAPLSKSLDENGNMIPRPGECAHGSLYLAMMYLTGIGAT